MPPVTRSSVRFARDRPQKTSEITRSVIGRVTGLARSRSTRLQAEPTASSARFSRPRRLAVPRDESPRRTLRLTSGLIDDSDEPDSGDDAAVTSSSHPVPAPPPVGLPTTSSTRVRRPSRQEAFAQLFPNYEHDQRRRKAAAAAKRRQRSQPKRRSLFGAHKTRRWFQVRLRAAGLRVTAEALQEVDGAMDRFEELVRGWLRQVTGPRRSATLADVLEVLRRSGTAGTEEELRRLIRRHLTLERQTELIRVAESGGRLYPAVNPLTEDTRDSRRR